MTDSAKRRPEAFVLDDKPQPRKATAKKPRRPLVVETPPPTEEPPAPVVAPAAPRRRPPFLKWLATGLGGLVSIAVGAWAWGLIEDLFARADWLGWTASALAALAVLGLLGFLVWEARAFLRLSRINHLREEAAAAFATDDPRAATAVSRSLIALYDDRPDMARARTAAAAHLGEVIDGRDLVTLVERDLMAGPDAAARALVRQSAKRVSMVTAISPRAVLDLVFVAFEIVRLSRRIAESYGGRPSGLAFLSLLKRIGLHLTVTGGIAMSDAIVQQMLGHGLAARLSARLGEGLFNGMMTARVGLAAIEVCRPMPFAGLRAPSIAELARELVAGAKAAEREADGKG
ncbi:MAG: YcjF family protein [Flavobacteriaceae bacterium]